MPSFSANRQGRPRPSDIAFKHRRSDDKSMPSPSFNSSMSLGKVDDVFFDSTRSVDRLRHHYLAMPATPSTLCSGSSPGARMERLPSLTELFNRDILSPPGSGGVPPSSMRSDFDIDVRRGSSSSSASSGRSRLWIPSFHQDCRTGSIGPPATPLSPYFTHTSAEPLVSPTTVSPDRLILDSSDGEATPRSSSRSAFDHTQQLRNTSPLKCPGAPRIGVLDRGRFQSQTWYQEHRTGSLGSFDGLLHRESYDKLGSSRLSAGDVARERDAMSRLESEIPKVAGLSGLGIYMDEDRIDSPFRRGSDSNLKSIESDVVSPSRRLDVPDTQHTGLTPMVQASKVFVGSSTPTRAKARTPPKLLCSDTSRDTLAKATSSSSTTATKKKKKSEVAQTPLGKSRPIFRFDTGSSKKSSKPKGHKISPNASPWGVFGVKDGWKPLAPPNVSRALAEANKVAAETHVGGSVPCSALKSSSPTNKRQVQSTEAASSPTKRTRTNGSQTSSSPYKENIDPLLRATSPSKRAQVRSKAYRESSTALPLSTIR